VIVGCFKKWVIVSKYGEHMILNGLPFMACFLEIRLKTEKL